MLVNPYIYQQNPVNGNKTGLNNLVSQIGMNVQMPTPNRNYCIFNTPLVNEIVKHRESAIPAIVNVLNNTNNEKVIAESIYILDRMIDSGVKGVENTYPALSRFNNTNSPTIQVLLAGVYRKTQVPDAFGPLCRMLIRNSLLPSQNQYFDPAEEVGGAILEYLKNNAASELYKNNPHKPS